MIFFDLPPPDITTEQIMTATPSSYTLMLKKQQNKLPQCIHQAAVKYNISEFLLTAIQRQEFGTIGAVTKHKNGSIDYGPFQINHRFWLPTIKEQYPAYTWVELAYDACTNTYVAAAILSNEIKNAEGDVWAGVGNYHHNKSRNLLRHYQYTSKVAELYIALVQVKFDEAFN